MKKVLVLALLVAGGVNSDARAQTAQDNVLLFYENLALEHVAGFQSFSAERGLTLFKSTFEGGKPDISACSTCHTSSPLEAGKTRAGKIIEPMALSVNGSRYTDTAKTEKWFRRNCKSVIGRECTALEKGDFLTFMFSQ